MSMSALKISDFVRERNEALFSLDRAVIEQYFTKRGIRIPQDDIVFWAAVYKCICNTKGAPAELVQKSKSWLRAHEMSERIKL